MVKTLPDEKYTYTPSVKNPDAIPLWFCFPAPYSIAMSSLGYLYLFRLFDENPAVSPERIFSDTGKTLHSPENVELMGFSFSFELDFLGLFKMLEKYKLPLRSAERDENSPLVFGGGPVLTANPEPFADFFDFIIIGEGEEIIEEIIQVYKEVKNSADKQEKLLRLAQINGIYVPSLYRPEYNPDKTVKQYVKLAKEAPDKINKRYIKDYRKAVYTPIVTKKSVFPEMFMIETSRGCPKRCSFCIASYLTLPARYPYFETIKDSIDTGLEYSKKLGFLGALITEHPDFEKICRYILEKREEEEFEISVSSLRVDTITSLIVETLVKCGQKQTTVAVEAGSDRLRKVVNKKLKEEDILKGVKIAYKNGLKGLKIYGMIGLPTETREDTEKLAELMIRLKNENKGFNLTLSVSSFVPKAQTPLQWSERYDNQRLEEINNFLRKELNTHKIHYKPTSIKWDYIQAVLSRGDRRLSGLLEKVYGFGGTIGSWNRAYRELLKHDGQADIPGFDWYALRKRSCEEILPWDIINAGVSRDQLVKEREKAFSLQ